MMNDHTKLWLAAALTLTLACGDDSDSSESGTTDGTDTAGDSDGTTTGDSDDSDGGGTDSGSGTGTTGEPPPSEVFIGGEVRDFVIDMPIVGAELSLWEMPGFETVSDDMGLYQIDGLPPSTEAAVILAPSEDYLGGVIPVTIAAEDRDNVQLTQISKAFIDEQTALLEDQMPVPPDDTQSIIVVRLIQNTATGAMVQMDPAPAAGTFYAPDENGAVILDESTISFGLLPVAVFFNVAPAGPGAYSFTVTHPERDCTVRHPSFPTLSGHVTQVEIDCPPPG